MKIFPLILFFTITTANSFAQSKDTVSQTGDIKILCSVNNHCYVLNGTGKETVIIRTQDSLHKFLESIDCRSMLPCHPYPDSIDFSKNSIIVLEYTGVDCLSSFKFSFKKETDYTCKLTITVTDGGCRAGGFHYVQLAAVPVIAGNMSIIKEIVNAR